MYSGYHIHSTLNRISRLGDVSRTVNGSILHNFEIGINRENISRVPEIWKSQNRNAVLARNQIGNRYQEHAKRNQNELSSSSGFEIMSSDTHLQLTASLHPNSEDDSKKPCKEHSSVRFHEPCDEKL